MFEGVTLAPDAEVWGVSYQEDGRINAMAGIVSTGGVHEGFLRYRVGWEPSKMWAARCAVQFREHLKTIDARVLAYCDPDVPTSERFVTWLGFRPTGNKRYGRVEMVRDGN